MDRPATISAWKSSLAAGKWPGPTWDKKSLVRQNRQQRQFPLEHRSRGGHFIRHLQGRGPPALVHGIYPIRDVLLTRSGQKASVLV